jgi:antitoxin HicB
MRYAVTLEPDENGTVIASVDGVPEAVTAGRSAEEALARAPDALIAALRGYIADGRQLPRVVAARRARPSVALPPLVATKLALYASLRDAGMTPADLAARLGRDEAHVLRLLDLDRRTPLDDLEAGLAALGRRLEIEVVGAA